MHLSWLGQNCLKIQTKSGESDVLVLVDAYKPTQGDFPRSFTPQIALFSAGSANAATLSGDPFVLDTLGEVEIKGVIVKSFPTENGTVIFKVFAENISIVHLGGLSKKPNVDSWEKLGTVDVLVIPVGGNTTLNATDAADVATRLEPRIVIPIGYKSPNDPKAAPASDFVKELGLKPVIEDKKIILKKKDLPQEEMQLMILEKS